MPTYRNNSISGEAQRSVRINDVNGVVQTVPPGGTVQTYDENVPTDFHKISDAPVYNRSVSRTISGQNTFTESIKPNGGLDIEISGTFSATVTLQRSWDDFSNVSDVDNFTEADEKYMEDPDTNVKYRIGIKTGEYTSGNATVKLSRRSV